MKGKENHALIFSSFSLLLAFVNNIPIESSITRYQDLCCVMLPSAGVSSLSRLLFS